MYEIFNRSEERHWWFIARRRIILSLVKSLLSPTGRSRILDVGCGMGATLEALQSLGDATGVDISPQAVEFARKRGCKDVRLVMTGELPFSTGEFDLIVAMDVIEHIEDDVATLKDYHRLLAPGGILLLTVPAFKWLWSGHDDDNFHLRRYTRHALKTKLENSGFISPRLTYFCTLLFPLVASVRLIERVLPHRNRETGDALSIPCSPINLSLEKIFSAERFWLACRGFILGSSILAISKKEGE